MKLKIIILFALCLIFSSCPTADSEYLYNLYKTIGYSDFTKLSPEEEGVDLPDISVSSLLIKYGYEESIITDFQVTDNREITLPFVPLMRNSSDSLFELTLKNTTDQVLRISVWISPELKVSSSATEHTNETLPGEEIRISSFGFDTTRLGAVEGEILLKLSDDTDPRHRKVDFQKLTLSSEVKAFATEVTIGSFDILSTRPAFSFYGGHYRGQVSANGPFISGGATSLSTEFDVKWITEAGDEIKNVYIDQEQVAYLEITHDSALWKYRPRASNMTIDIFNSDGSFSSVDGTIQSN